MGVGALAAYLLRKPHVLYIHELGKKEHGVYFDLGRGFTLKLLSRTSALWLANSKATKEEFAGFARPDQITVVYQSVVALDPKAARDNLERFHQDPPRFRCVNVGTLHPGKKQEDAVKAVTHLLKLGLDLELVIVGDGLVKYESCLKDLVEASGFGANISFTGYVTDPTPIIKTADVLLVCSIHEAFGRVTIEGMLAGKPVIGARSGATAEFIKEDVNGLLYTPGNHRDLAEKIKYLYENPDIGTQLGSNAQTWSTSMFKQKYYGERVFYLLNKVANRRKSR